MPSKPRKKKEQFPISFLETAEALQELCTAHPELPGDLRKALERFLKDVSKVSAKHGVSLVSSVSFKTSGGANGF